MTLGNEVTQLLEAQRHGDADAGQRLFEIVYRELHTIARRQLRYRRPGQTLNTTGLVHEAYLKMFDGGEASWEDRAHFFAVTATAMRQILVDHVRKLQAEKRGAQAPHTDLHTYLMGEDGFAIDILDLDEALSELAELNPRLSQVVELRFFVGLTLEEIAQSLDVTTRTVDRDWYKAKAFLQLALTEKRRKG